MANSRTKVVQGVFIVNNINKENHVNVFFVLSSLIK